VAHDLIAPDRAIAAAASADVGSALLLPGSTKRAHEEWPDLTGSDVQIICKITLYLPKDFALATSFWKMELTDIKIHKGYQPANRLVPKTWDSARRENR
jgi:hypothetical protein